MKVYVQSVNFNADKELIEFIEKKVNGLEKFYDKIVDSEVFLKVQQTSEKENKVVEITRNVLVQLYKQLWTRRSFWANDLRNSPN